ncbi:MAG TPA: cupredoxin domain-containing protein [Casimicrobiaceae bacterium]
MKRWTLVFALLAGLSTMILLFHREAAADTRVIAIKAHRFEFTPDAITLKKGETVTLQLTSDDLMHGFLVKPLKIETDIVPGKVTELIITPQKTGTFRVNCDHYCGAGHGDMHMTLTVTE